MSLYYDAQTLLSKSESSSSLKSRVYNGDLKSPAQVYALVVEATKWSPILKEVVERCQLLRLEKKLTPALALLLVHDLLISKKGIAAPKKHPLRVAVEKHKARLNAEFVKARLRRRCPSIAAMKMAIESDTEATFGGADGNIQTPLKLPRWIRINTLVTTLSEQLQSTFHDFTQVTSLSSLLRPSSPSSMLLFVDSHIPDLVAIPRHHDMSKHPAYLSGALIFQDKASCLPAYLLDPASFKGDIIDACAAPGNKTTHLAALMSEPGVMDSVKRKIFACERSHPRSLTLQKMVHRADADDAVTIKAGQDFLRVNPLDRKYANVHAILLDPSCSGSGILGRDDDEGDMRPVLPSLEASISVATENEKRERKRKKRTKGHSVEEREKSKGTRGKASAFSLHMADAATSPPPEDSEMQGADNDEAKVEVNEKAQEARLESLSHMQTLLLRHALSFPHVTRVVYSTCSLHAIENEFVIYNALSTLSHWRLLGPSERPTSLRNWKGGGDMAACLELYGGDVLKASELRDSVLRCSKGGDGNEGGTGGFFIAGLVRSNHQSSIITEGVGAPTVRGESEEEGGEEWSGFDA